MIGILPAAAAAPTKELTSDRTDAALGVVYPRACGTEAIRSRMTAARESPGLAATHLAPAVAGSTSNADSAALTVAVPPTARRVTPATTAPASTPAPVVLFHRAIVSPLRAVCDDPSSRSVVAVRT